MKEINPVERVAKFLEGAGYRRVPGPLVINRINFLFPVVFVGTQRSNDLILVADTACLSESDIVRMVLGVARALDVARSNNPLTTIIVGPRPSQSSITEMMSVCRVLALGSLLEEDDGQALANGLAILTRISLVNTDGVVADPILELKKNLDGLPERVLSLMEAIGTGVGVKGEMDALLTQELEKAWEADE